MTNLITFHADEAVKAKYLARVDRHIQADNLIRAEAAVSWAAGAAAEAAAERIWNAAKADLDAIRPESEDEFKRLRALYEQARGRLG